MDPKSGHSAPALDHSLKTWVFLKRARSRGKERGSLWVGTGLPCSRTHKGSLVWEWFQEVLWDSWAQGCQASVELGWALSHRQPSEGPFI